MAPRPTLLAFALVSLPVVAAAQDVSVHARPVASRDDHTHVPPFAAPVELTRHGVRDSVQHTLVQGLSVVDVQRADVDGDGDDDALLLVDLAEGDAEPKPDAGRGLVIAYRERRGWRGETIASVGRFPIEAGYNWGPVEALRSGGAPLLHVMYSQAHPGSVGVQRDTVVLFDRGTLRPVFDTSVESVPGGGDDAVARTLSVQASDVNGDGVSELLVRVAERANCPEAGCANADGLIDPTETRRVLRWDASSRSFVDDAAALARTEGARAALAASRASWRAGRLDERDSSIARAFRLDPLDANVRLSYARLQLRERAFDASLDTLGFSWPASLGPAALALRAEASAAAGEPNCARSIAAVREPGSADDAALAARLAARFPACR